MEVFVYEGKNKEEVLTKALTDLDITENDVIIKEEKIKGKLFKSDSYKYTIIKLVDIQNEIKIFLKNILNLMDIDVTFESSIKEKQLCIKMYSNNNSILIGKNGQTLSSLTTICKQFVYNLIGQYPYLNLDVENYKDKQIYYLEKLAKNIAREVRNTKQEVVMENMNSYERRIVHNVLTNFKGVTTISEGEEPNRHVIVKPKGE